MTVDLFAQINNAVLDLQAAQYQTYERPLKKLATLLHHADLEAIRKRLTANLDLETFLAESDKTGGSMVGSHTLLWPDDHEQTLGMTLLLIDKLAADSHFALNFGHQYFSSNSSVISGIRSLTSQMIIPFVRDYAAFVRANGKFEPQLKMTKSNKVFIVHGHDDAALQGLARFIEKLGLEAIILKEQPDQGRTIIEKFEDSATDVGFAVILLTPDDIGSTSTAEKQSPRARQNVVFELGYFSGKLGRGHVCLLRKGNVEIPSDLFGVIYTEMDSADGWKHKLAKELRAAKLEFDLDRFFAA
ncbi:TIR domain-containing protein [Roseateles toxinivorans]|uniref:Putative nucleotide-binding protein with TIR-like domain n=1 Tax=Roseateles toxinivorans TaxID=270368 RepID=A0A4R6QDW2_9BURK|nr:nucleotide-binding protein [Roseateles toxinivorans]TDP60651.1 putative nucleotide-binding protein with TIR-like domain [Roseateles toxinivorans]